MLLAGGNGDLGADRRAAARGGGWLAQRARRPRLATTPVAIWHPQTGRFLCDHVSSWADVCCDRCQAIGVGRTRMVTNVICNCWHCASLVVFVRVCRRRRRAARRSGHIGVLSSATAGRLERSDRCDRLLLPLGLRTRAAPGAGRRLHMLGRALLREPGSPDFGGRARRTSNRAGARCRLGRYYGRRPRPDDPRRRARDPRHHAPRPTPNAGSKSFRMSGQDYRIRSGRSRPACGKWRTRTARKTRRRARGEGPVAGW